MSATTRIQTEDALAALRARLASRAGGVLEREAAEHGVSLRTVIGCLPHEMWRETGGERFCEVMAEVAGWGAVTLIVHTEDGVFEFAGPLPPGTLGQGFFHLHGTGGLSGHLRAERCHSIVFLRRPFMGKQTASIQFFNAAGGAMFKIFVGRDAAGELCAAQLARFAALERRLAAPA
jgi:putative heme utilization carrier protein HutX